MEGYRPSRVLRVITAILSFTYVVSWVLAGLLVVGVPAYYMFAGPETLKKFPLSVPVHAQLPDAQVESTWGGQPDSLVVNAIETRLLVPFFLAPAWFRAAGYAFNVIGMGLLLLFLFHLRAFFRSARDGTPFDARNASRLRWMGGLLLAIHLLTEAFTTWQAAVVLRTVSRPPVPLAASFDLDEQLVLIAFMLLALAEIFNRGARLEDEQSLVV
jgi:hypothetical protein